MHRSRRRLAPAERTEMTVQIASWSAAHSATRGCPFGPEGSLAGPTGLVVPPAAAWAADQLMR